MDGPGSMDWTPGVPGGPPSPSARRRSLVAARHELEASEQRGEPATIVDAWRDVVSLLARAELARLAESDDVA